MERLFIDNILTFGKHKGKSISAICEIEPTYIEWCILNIPTFYIHSNDLINSFQKFNYKATEELINVLKIKDDKFWAEVIANGTRSTEIWGEMMHLSGWTWQTFPPKPKNDQGLYAEKILFLKTNWTTIFSDIHFLENTYPLWFTGKKGRRLVIKKKCDFVPPWGSWYDHLKNGKPSKFTELRKGINEKISPLEIDHIDFID